MFTALINLVVDFLFVDILFAPTMKGTTKLPAALLNEKSSSKETQQQLDTKVKRQVQPSSNLPTPPSKSTSLTPVTKDSSNHFKRVTRLTLNKIQSGNLHVDLETTRVLPSATLEAHELAKISVNDIIDDRVSAIRKTLLRQETQRRASSRRSVSFMKSIPLSETSVEDQFVDLTVDIAEQRRELKRSQQDKFDEMWG
jgi:hypothetical protein